MTTPNSGADPYRSGNDPTSTGEEERPRWTAATCLVAFGLTIPLVYGLYPVLAAVTQTFGGLSTTALVVCWAAAWLVLWIAFQSVLEWRTGVAGTPS
ncbi:hypothetical protein [Natrarchaeobaculum aegyptiacum]|uniref:Uncharacterized protein n=1 Tax=Natrarchaeobaculum aegyptiacum TaxID=745377 RepID=A0A2Z2HTA8_9EURY|nr:hypothetical protein [Natrarchaeobaculum aegyptiacum]ARS90471.1 hypothetical protein B1756_12520 [Natrarchaeobaculum aegyptiacum]